MLHSPIEPLEFSGDQAPVSRERAARRRIGYRALRHMLAKAWRSGDLPILRDQPIVWRFHSLTALGIGALLAFAAAFGVGEIMTSRAARDQAAYGALRDHSADLRTDFLALQTSLTAFLDQPDRGVATQLRQIAARSAESLAKMRELPVAAEDQETLESLSKALVTIDSDLGAISQSAETLGYSEFEGLRFKLSASIKAMQSEIEIWPNQDPLMARILQMRLAEKDFLMQRNESLLGRHKRWANEVDLKIDSGGLDPATRDKFHTLLTAYLADWKAFGETSLASATAHKDLVKTLREAGGKLDQLFDHAQEASRLATLAGVRIRAAALWITLMIGLIAAALFLLASSLFSRSATRPVAAMERAMGDLAKGNRDVVIPGVGRKDEIGDMAKAVQVFKDNIDAMQEMQDERARQNAALAKRGADLDHLTQVFDRETAEIMRAVAQATTALQSRATDITSRARLTSEQMLQIDSASRQATEGVNSIAAAVEELAAQVHEINLQVGESTRVTGEATQAASRADELMIGLAQSAQNIGEVVAMITSIAHKTHMLALNATIESVRAGDAGRGFAIVAQEVKSLSNQTSNATGDIASQIREIQDKTTHAVSSIARIVATSEQIRGNAGSITNAVEHQHLATRDIAHNAALVAEGSTQVAGKISFAAQQAEEMGLAAQKMLEDATATAGRTEQLREKVAGFLRDVAAMRG